MSKTKVSLIITTLFAVCVLTCGCDSEALKKQFQGKFGNIRNQGAKNAKGVKKQKKTNSRLEQLRSGKSKKYYKNSPGTSSKSSIKKSSGITRMRRNGTADVEPVKERIFGFDEDKRRKKRTLSKKRTRSSKRAPWKPKS